MVDYYMQNIALVYDRQKFKSKGMKIHFSCYAYRPSIQVMNCNFAKWDDQLNILSFSKFLYNRQYWYPQTQLNMSDKKYNKEKWC